MSDSYLALFLNSALSQGSLLGPLSLLLLFFGRFLPIIALSPFFGARVLPHPVKVMFAITMFVVFLPKLLEVTKTPLTFDSMLPLFMAKELFIGFLLGFIIGMPFMIVQNAGIIIDHQRGGASLMVNDPTIQNQSSPLGTLFNFIMIVIFYALDGPFLFIDALITSYEVVPPDQFFNPSFFSYDSSFWKPQMMDLLNKVMTITIRLASPALLTILMTDVFLGIANRLAPQVQITFLGMPLKSLLALTIIFFGWQLFTEELSHEIYYWLSYVNNTLKIFKASMPL
ncbi:MAG TPA: flagellar biosynthetic protein FliR [Parachlamydiaceae bacterium]|nr:flagellar biosynthetic protein FliR [Parachlamydiaceae bacterium]